MAHDLRASVRPRDKITLAGAGMIVAPRRDFPAMHQN